MARRNFPATEGRGSGAGGFSPEPPLSSTCQCSTSAQPSPTPVPAPPPRASVHLDSSSLSSPLLLLPLAFLPHFSPLFFSYLSFCILSPPRGPAGFSPPPGRRGGGKRAAPGACAALREAFLLLLPGNLERLYVRARARELKAKRGRIQRPAERVGVFDVPHQLHKSPEQV